MQMTRALMVPRQVWKRIKRYVARDRQLEMRFSKTSISRQLTLDRLCSIDSTQLTALLHAQPWLFKTKMCKFWPSCPRGNKCWFAHGEDELRKPNSVAYMFSGAPFGPNGEAN